MKNLFRLFLLCTGLCSVYFCLGQSKPNEMYHDASIEGSNVPNRQSVLLYTIHEIDDRFLISFSDIYPLEVEISDTLIMPSILERGIDSAQYFLLDATYRNRFLTETHTSETDSVFMYDYSQIKLVTIPVSDLDVVAILNPYSSLDEWPYYWYSYMIGFELKAHVINKLGTSNVFVYVGKENPFSMEPLTPIDWKKIPNQKFPTKTIVDDFKPYFDGLKMNHSYVFIKDNTHFFLQDYLSDFDILAGRRLLVVDSITNDIILEKYYGMHEGTSPTPLNDAYDDEGIFQWTGKLFKHKPPVLFGLEFESFGCPSISVIDRTGEDIIIQCDNRH